MNVLLIDGQDREQVIADFASAMRTIVPDVPLVLLMAYLMPPERMARVEAAVRDVLEPPEGQEKTDA